jgi:predicted acylesterase/phospholipase RssA/CRP-like cAMP-binding protein
MAMAALTSDTLSSTCFAHIAQHGLFADLDAETVDALSGELTTEHLAAGTVLFQQGDVGDSMFFITKGRLGVRITSSAAAESVVDELLPGVTVGEMSLMTGQPRAAVAYAIEDIELVRLSKVGFDLLATRQPERVRQFVGSITPRLLRTQLAEALTHLFGPFDSATIHEVQAALEWQRLDPGEALFHAGDVGDSMYILVNGLLRIAADTPEGERTFSEVGRGECVGEFALLTGEARTATVYAVRASDVVKLSQALFQRLIHRHPDTMLRIARLVVRRAVAASEMSRQTDTATFAIIPTHDAVPLAVFAQQLVAALEGLGPTLHLSAEALDRMISHPGAAQTDPSDSTDIALAGWLNQQAARYRYVVFEADYRWSNWTRRCIGNADCVIVLGRSGDDPALSRLEQAIRDHEMQARMDLVLLHPEGTQRPHATATWLQPRTVTLHHHVRLGHTGDMARLARRLTGRTIGVVLGGGGARGHAHIGALRALEEAGIRIDVIGGTSMGALIGASYAIDHSYAEMVDLAKTSSSRKQLIDLTLPLTSFAASRKVTELYQHMFGDTHIEDLWRPYFCMSSNLTRAEPMIHSEGPLWAAVRASSAIPAIFTPMQHSNGDVLVDGGVMNNLPIDVMRQRFDIGHVIGINVTPAREKMRNYRFGPSVSGWDILWRRINPFAQKLRAPSLFGSIMRTVEINDAYRMKSPAFQHVADLLIHLPLEQFRTLDFDSYAAIIECGYQATQQIISTHAAQLDRMITLK